MCCIPILCFFSPFSEYRVLLNLTPRCDGPIIDLVRHVLTKCVRSDDHTDTSVWTPMWAWNDRGWTEAWSCGRQNPHETQAKLSPGPRRIDDQLKSFPSEGRHHDEEDQHNHRRHETETSRKENHMTLFIPRFLYLRTLVRNVAACR